MSKNKPQAQSVLGEMAPSKAIVKLAIPATLALLAKAIYNLVDTAYIGMLHSDIALTAVGVTAPLLLIMVSIENIFAAGAAVLAGRQLGAKDSEGASRTITTIIGISVVSNFTRWMWKPTMPVMVSSWKALASMRSGRKLVSRTSMQSPALARITRGSGRMSPQSTFAR